MAVIPGTGAYRYEVMDSWAKLPPEREFNADVAAVGVDRQDRVYAFNRGEHTMVVFDGDGNFLRSWGEGVFRRAHGVHMAPWNNMHRPSGLFLERSAQPRFYVGEIGGGLAVNYDVPNIGPRISIYSEKGELLTRLGERPAGLEPGQFISPHGLAVDSRGDIYVGEVSLTNWGNRYKGQPHPPGLRNLQKLVKAR
jgi:hypothetical protein